LRGWKLRAPEGVAGGLIPFAIKDLLNEERCFGGGQPCGLAAAQKETLY